MASGKINHNSDKLPIYIPYIYMYSTLYMHVQSVAVPIALVTYTEYYVTL